MRTTDFGSRKPFIREIIATMVSAALIKAVRRELRRRRVPENAAPMQAYMKSKMPFLGVQTGEMRAACRSVFAGHPLESFDDWRETVLELWHSARYREERYVAIELTGHRAYRRFQLMKSLPMYGKIVSTGAWWDLVDPIATQRLGILHRRCADGMAAKMRTWSRSRDIWRRRAAIISQLKLKRETDSKLLFDCIRPSMSSSEFFLRKGIGWALREHAKSFPEEVLDFVRRHEEELSGLSKREALKHLGGIRALSP
jgi:3-methyladenine DNA glycosylase AlkD